MEIEEMEQDLQMARTAWGDASQMRMAQEECGELVAAINRFDRGRITNEQLAEEIADVIITVMTAKLIVGPSLIDSAIESKIYRLRDLISKHAWGD
jgi:NTP pyrophosphatase (non-canonical NTP hydrolase)